MSLLDLFLTAVALSMDAFAVAMCKGLSVGKSKIKYNIITGIYFGVFQALMPLIGYLLGRNFQGVVESIDHWIAFILLSLIGFNMVKEALGSDEDDIDSSFAPKSMIPLAIATSIDALAMGVSFSFFPDFNIISAVIFIGVTTFILSGYGVYLGSRFGTKYKAKSEFAGGIILILMGLKILLEHLGLLVLPF